VAAVDRLTDPVLTGRADDARAGPVLLAQL
jgi:hypothetical protein